MWVAITQHTGYTKLFCYDPSAEVLRCQWKAGGLLQLRPMLERGTFYAFPLTCVCNLYRISQQSLQNTDLQLGPATMALRTTVRWGNFDSWM